MFEIIKKKIVLNTCEIKPIFNSIFQDTQSIIKGEKSFYEINNDSLPVVAYLASSHKSYFKNINAKELESENYETLKGYLEAAITTK